MATVKAECHGAVAADTWAGRVLEGQGHQRYLSTPEGLRDAAARVAEAAADLGCSNVMAASTHAAGALSAAVLLNPGLHSAEIANVWSGQVDKVLLVETVAVSGLRLRKAASAAYGAGASWVGVVVLFPVLGAGERDIVRGLGLEAVDAVHRA